MVAKSRVKVTKNEDPEDIGMDALRTTESSSSSEDEFDGREHYVKVDRGKLRMNVEMEMDSKYQGKKSRRAEIFPEEDDALLSEEEQVSTEEDDFLSSNEDEIVSSEGEDEEEENESNASHSPTQTAQKSPQQETLSHEQFSEHDSEDDVLLKNQLSALNTQETNFLSKTADHIQSDVHQGEHVRSQMALFDYLLDARIQLQKAVSLGNTLPLYTDFKEWQQSALEEWKEAEMEVTGLLDDLLSFRELLLQNNPVAELKRKRSEEEDPLLRYWDDIESLEMVDFTRKAIDHWDNKVKMSSAGSALAAKKFKAINQSVLNQIDHVLQDEERLLKKTRVMRTPLTIIGQPDSTHLSTDNDNSIKNETEIANATLAESFEVFDDLDFYQILLKDFIESKMSNAEDPVALGLKITQLKQLQEQKKKQVDTKASKGRKIRYHVMEKLVNFMAPEPRGDWHDEMREQLFSSLFGLNQEQNSNEIVLPTDGFRIMG